MIKKLSLILLLIISNCYSQEINTDIRAYKSFKEGTTYFVKSSDSKYNKILNDILIKYWTLNKFEIIPSSQVSKLKKDSSFFVDLVEYSFTRRGGTTGALDMDYGVPKLAMFKEYKNSKPKEVISLVQLNEISSLEMLYAIQLLQYQINFVFELNTQKDLDVKDFLEKINEKNKKKIQGKKLQIIPSMLKKGINTEDELKKIYSHKFEITNQARINQAIENQEEDIVYIKIINYRNLKFVLFMNAKNSELLYGKVMTGFNQAEIGPKFFKDINE